MKKPKKHVPKWKWDVRWGMFFYEHPDGSYVWMSVGEAKRILNRYERQKAKRTKDKEAG